MMMNESYEVRLRNLVNAGVHTSVQVRFEYM